MVKAPGIGQKQFIVFGGLEGEGLLSFFGLQNAAEGSNELLKGSLDIARYL